MDPRCRVEMLGPLRLVRGGETLRRFGTQKAAALLAYLALRPGPQSREQVIDAFWPDMDLPAGRDNLSTTLTALRRMLEPPGVRKGTVLVTSHAHAGLDPAAVTTDVTDFERLLHQGEGADDPAKRADLLGRAVALYAGDFQPGNYQDWAVRESDRLQACHVQALTQLADDLEALGRFVEAAAITQRRVAADPYAEEAHVGLIRRLTLAGQPTAAREAGDKFQQFFEKEFGAGPSAGARTAVEKALSRSAPDQPPPAPNHGDAGSSVSSLAPPLLGSETASRTEETVPTTLPFWLSHFFGRDAEMTRLASLLLPAKAAPDGPDLPAEPCRLVTLIGPGGAGKTRLAAEFGRRASERFGHWCAFVPLADLTAPDQIPSQIAGVLRLPTSPTVPPLEQIGAFFREHVQPGSSRALLILDNLEHLLGKAAGRPAAGIVQALLRDAPGLSILCTSRQRLGLAGERLMSAEPLPVPPDLPVLETPSPEALAEMARVPSVVLYVDRAQSVRPDFGLTPTNAPAVAALCRALEGSPLALELAASWVRLLPPRKMWERLAQGMEMPEGRHEDLPTRHRSLAAALDWSWRLLTEPQRRLLARLSVFRGGWTLEAAEAVSGEPYTLHALAGLQEASLVTAQEDADGESRFGLLETVRQYASDRLMEQSAEEDDGASAVRERHLAWYLGLAHKANPELYGPQQSVWLTRLDADMSNLRAALDWSAQETPQTAMQTEGRGLQLARSLGMFWMIRGHFEEGRARLAAALALPDSQALTQMRAEALNLAGMLATEQSDLAAARSLYEEALAINRKINHTQGIMGCLNNIAIAVYDQGDRTTSRTLWEEGLVLARESGSARGIASTLGNLGEMAFDEGDLGKAQSLLEESLSWYRTTGSKSSIAYILQVLVSVAHRQGDLSSARCFLAECLPLQHDIGHKAGIAQTLEAAAALALTAGQPDKAARLAGTAEALRQAIGAPLPANERTRHETAVAASRAALGEGTFKAAFEAGRAMTWEQAVAYALEETK